MFRAMGWVVFYGGLATNVFSTPEEDFSRVGMVARLLGEVDDGSPPEAPTAVRAELSILSSCIIHTPDGKLTIRQAEPPTPRPKAVLAGDGSQGLADGEDTDGESPETVILLISATVHQGRLTHLHGVTSGGAEFTAWTDLDFNDFCGFSSFSYGGRQYGLVMGVSDDPAMPPEAVFPAKQGGFHFEDGLNAETQAVADAFAALWIAEWETLSAARKGRDDAAKDAAAKPPVPPSDIVLTFWDKPSRPLNAAEKSQRDLEKERAR